MPSKFDKEIIFPPVANKSNNPSFVKQNDRLSSTHKRHRAYNEDEEGL